MFTNYAWLEKGILNLLENVIFGRVHSGGSRISRRGGVDLVGGAWTPEAATFHKICMSK